MPPASLEIRLLGPLEVERDGRLLELPPSRKARALLAYLAATGGSHAREQICDIFWDGPVDPRGALRGALSKLRRVLDDARANHIVPGGDRVALDTTGITVDLTTIRAVASDLVSADLELLERCAASFRGELLEGLDLPDCYRFDAWRAAQREVARGLRSSILSTLVVRLADTPNEALRYARERLRHDPFAEAAHMDVMRLLARLGRVREAREQYESCRRILESELHVRPSRELEALRRAILPPPVPAALRSQPSPEPRADGPRRPPIVGRERERHSLERSIHAAARGDGEPMLLLTGEPGIGKTRLLDEAAAMVRARGGEVLAGRAFEAEILRPYGALIDALRAIPPYELPAELRLELSTILPELGSAPPDAADRGRLFGAVAQLLVTRAADSRPVVLMVDDLQWIDEASASLLHYVVRGCAGQGVLLLCASRRVEIEDNIAAARLLRALRRTGSVHQIHVGPLDAAATARLVRGVGTSLDADRIFARSEGNPLFALEIARAGRDDDTVPGTLQELIGDRLAQLDPSARGLLPWASGLGHDFTLDTLGRTAGLQNAELLLAVEELERRNVLQPVGNRYDFTHDMVREVAYRQLSEPRRRLVHSRIARILEEADDSDHELAGDVAHHAALGGERELAARASLAAARRALWAFAPEEASQLVELGIRHLDGLSTETRTALHLELLGLSVYPGMKEHRLPEIESRLSRIIGEAHAAGLQAQVQRGFQLLADVHFLDGDFGGALDRSLRAQEAGRAADPATVVRAIGDTARCLGLTEHDMPLAAKLAREAAALARGVGYEGHELAQALGHVHHHRGELDDASASFERAASLARNEHARWFECASLAQLVMIDVERGRASDALERCRELLTLTDKLDEGSDAPFARALEALALMQLGESDAAARLEDALTELSAADSRWTIAYIQNMASEIDIAAGRIDAARGRAANALEAATAIERCNEVAISHSLLARLSLKAGDREAAIPHIEAVLEEPRWSGTLSARASAAVEAAHRAYHEDPAYGGASTVSPPVHDVSPR
ncbi:MAG TPA: AAA family ATPase [Gemmatimonadaceae bacterium]|nr:AAA family ATPase [Gemmatimonadaceae bacterium]